MALRKKKILGLDVGSHTIKAVELVQDGDKVELAGIAEGSLTAEKRVEDARKILSGARISTRRVVTAVSGRSVIIRYINMVEQDDESLRKSIVAEAKKYIPFDIEEVILDCQRLDKKDVPPAGEEEKPAKEVKAKGKGKEMKVLLVAVKRDYILEHAGFLRQLSLQPVVVDVDAFAIGNAYEMWAEGAPEEEVSGVTALLDIGATKTNVNIMNQRISCFTREVYIGGNDFREAIQKQMGVEEVEAENLLLDPGDKAAAIQQAAATVLEELGNEVRLSFDYFESQFENEVGRIRLSGGMAYHPGFDGVLQDLFQKPTAAWNPLERIPRQAKKKFDEERIAGMGARFAVAAGLAYRLLG
ncbi:MAG: type IV pilus assembly protein PilM [Planctomycetota bacterium]